MITSIIQQMKIAISKLSGESKEQALELLDKANLAHYQKIDYSNQIKAIFSELQAVHNRSEKLHQKAINLFDKDKSYSPMAIKGMAQGETTPSKWLVSCAIDILIDERKESLESMLSADDLFMLWAKPLLQSTLSKENIFDRATSIDSTNQIKNKLQKLQQI